MAIVSAVLAKRTQAGYHRGADRFEIVAALQHPDAAPLGVPYRPTPDQRRQLSVALGRYVQGGQRVVAMGVKARRNQDQLGSERIQRRADRPLVGGQEPAVAGAGG